MSNLDAALKARISAASNGLSIVHHCAGRLRHTGTDAQIYALALHATVIELFSACILLAEQGRPAAIPVVLRSMYEALVDLDNLLQDSGYVEYLDAANLKQTLKLMNSATLKTELRDRHPEEYESFARRYAELKAAGKTSLSFECRFKKAGRAEEYDSNYALFCLDGHNNGAALADRHLSETQDGIPLVSIFGDYDPTAVAMRLNLGLKFLLQSAHMIHRAFQIGAPEVDEFAHEQDREKLAINTSTSVV
jgi:hypothetical protein